MDADCRVLGVQDLRVVDSSIMPRIPYGNLNAPSIMIDEKAAAHILAQKSPSMNAWLISLWRCQKSRTRLEHGIKFYGRDGLS